MFNTSALTSSWTSNLISFADSTSSLNEYPFPEVKLSSENLIDIKRIYAVGYSNGGMMAYRLGCEIPELITGVGVGAGAFTVQGCSPTKSVSLLQITGDQDAKVPQLGGGPYSVVSAETSTRLFAIANTCTAVMQYRSDIDWDCPNNSAIKLLIDVNQGHQWNSNWTEAMISFLNAHTRT